MKKIALMTSGGDAPGMNAFIRGAALRAFDLGFEVFGIKEGYQGLIENKIEPINKKDIEEIIHLGGTFLKSSRSKEFRTPEGRIKAAKNLDALAIDALICCGGNGSYAGLQAFAGKDGEWQGQVLGSPGTIDNDVKYTDYTIGFDTAINTAVQVIDNLRDTGDSHNMNFIVEVMGRHCGDIADAVAKASGSEFALIPETPTDIDAVMKAVIDEKNELIIIAEGDEVGGALKLEGELKERICSLEDKNCSPNFRVCILGHIQRGGRPTARDRILAHDMAEFLVEAFDQGESQKAVAIQGTSLCLTELI